MHRCIELTAERRSEYVTEDLEWKIALHLRIEIEHNRVSYVELCQHETFSIVNMEELLDRITALQGDVFSVLNSLVKILDEMYFDWRRKFEVYLAENEMILRILI